MNLFFTDKQSQVVKADLLRQATPLGKLVFDLSFPGRSAMPAPQQTIFIPEDIYISTWTFNECQVEFLKLHFHPKLPPELFIEECFCGIWRVRVFSGRLTLNFDCFLESTLPRGILGTPEFGEGLIARSWENDRYKLTIGTDSEDSLAHNAYLQKGQTDFSFPKERPRPETIHYLKNGLRIILSDLSKEDFVQVHFAAAWTPGSYPRESTLHAVNQSPDQILKYGDIY